MARGPSSKEPQEDREVRRREILEQLDGDQAGSPQGRATSVLQALKKVAERCDMASTVKEVLEVTPRGEGVGPGGLVCPDRGGPSLLHHFCSPGGGSPKESGEKTPPAGGSPKTSPRSGSPSVEEITQMMDALRMDKRHLLQRLEASQHENMLMGEARCSVGRMTHRSASHVNALWPTAESKVKSLQSELEEAQEESNGLAQRVCLLTLTSLSPSQPPYPPHSLEPPSLCCPSAEGLGQTRPHGQSRCYSPWPSHAGPVHSVGPRDLCVL